MANQQLHIARPQLSPDLCNEPLQLQLIRHQISSTGASVSVLVHGSKYEKGYKIPDENFKA